MNFTVFNQLSRVVAGGQTGVDRAALDWAITRKIAHSGWCPRGRYAEDGRLDARYRLLEMASESVLAAAERNVAESEGTLIINVGELEGVALAARQFAEQAAKPCLVLQLEGVDLAPLVDGVASWMKSGAFSSLTIAGPQESERPRIYRLTRLFLASV
jgi:hypothetical protein